MVALRMDRAFDHKKKQTPPHRWLGLRPVDFVRAAERRAIARSRAIVETTAEQSGKIHAPLTRIRRPRTAIP